MEYFMFKSLEDLKKHMEYAFYVRMRAGKPNPTNTIKITNDDIINLQPEIKENLLLKIYDVIDKKFLILIYNPNNIIYLEMNKEETDGKAWYSDICDIDIYLFGWTTATANINVYDKKNLYKLTQKLIKNLKNINFNDEIFRRSINSLNTIEQLKVWNY